ncbi:MAG: hypothetical protein COB04_09960 [Gammaproteobacteria bacterium]|nr:MAG: hypothetical protein COB04_09960 [Gammaproteobacteria bacterium]
MDMFKKLSFTLIILGVAGVVIGALTVFKPEVEKVEVKEQLPAVTVQQAVLESATIPVYTRGIINFATEIFLVAEVQGRIEDVSDNFASGGSFKKGEVLLRIDPISYELDLSNAEAKVATARLNVERVRADVRSNKQARSKIGKARIQEANAQLSAAKAGLTRVKLLLDRTEIRAPFDGRIRSTTVDIGQYITPGVQVARVYATDVAEISLPLSNIQQSLVQIPVQYDGEELQGQGSPVLLKVASAGQEYYWPGKVVRTEGGINEVNRLMHVVAVIESPYTRDTNQPDRPPLLPGDFAEVEIEGRQFNNVVVLPREAIRNANQVWTIGANLRLKVKEVEILHRGRDEVYISDGIDDGEFVVLTQLDVVVDGMRVQLANNDLGQEAEYGAEQAAQEGSRLFESGTPYADGRGSLDAGSREILIEEAEPPAPLLEND